MKRLESRIGRILLACVADHDWASPPPGIPALAGSCDLSDLGALAHFHGVAGCVFQSLHGVDKVDESVLAELRQSYNGGVRSHLRALAGLASLANVLDGVGSPWMVVKGPVLAELVYGRPDLRSYADLDLLVLPTALGDTIAALERAGCTVLDKNWRMLTERMIGQLQLSTPNSLAVDLHWHLLNDARLRDHFAVPTKILFERSRTAVLGGTRVATLDPVDTLLHLALHAAMAGGNRLLWLKDLEQSIRNEPPAWDEVIRRARGWGIGLAVATMIGRTRRCLRIPVPKEVMPALAPQRAWRHLTASVDHLAPVERADGSGSLSRIVARSARRDGWSSGRELGRRSSAWLREVSQLAGEVDRSRRESGANALLRPVGGRRARVAFIDAVARWSDP